MRMAPSSISPHHGAKKVVIIRHEGTEDETRTEASAVIQTETGFFDLNTHIHQGDIVEIPNQRGGVDRKLAAKVHRNRHGPQLQQTQVLWGEAPDAPTVALRRLSIEHLHHEVISAASGLFTAGHYASAVHAAFESIDARLRQLAGIDQSGAPLTADAPSGKPKLAFPTPTRRIDLDDQKGFLSLFRGYRLADRDPKTHPPTNPADPQHALEYLGLASLLHRQLDIALDQQT
jgi:uncharacterized protein (TIGR02391 family)